MEAASRLGRQPRFVVAVLIAGAVIAVLALWQTGVLRSDEHYLVERPSPAVPKAISVNEAWDLVWEEARQWRDQPELLELSAMGAYEPPDERAGADGRRRYWLANFRGRDGTLFVQVFDGKVVRAIETPGTPADEGRPITAKPALDSTTLVPQVLAARTGFAGSSGNVVGIGVALSAAEDGRTLVAVVGRYQGRDASARVDTATGEILEWNLLVPTEAGGVLYSSDGGVTWQASNLVGKHVASVAGTAQANGHGFASVEAAAAIELYETVDGGASWTAARPLPEAAGLHPSGLIATNIQGQDVVVVSTTTGVWFSPDSGATWEKASGLPTGLTGWLAVAEEGRRSRVFVTLSGASRGVYASSDLATWTKEVDGTYRLSQSFDRREVLAIDPSTRGDALAPLFGAVATEESRWIFLTDGAMRAAGAFDGSEPLVSQSTSKIRFSTDAGDKPRTTLESETSSLAAAPDFSASRVLVAGGRYTGLFRSGDGGATWQQVLTVEELAAIVPGTNSIPRAVFLSPTHVIAVNGGDIAWEAQ